MMTSFFTPLSRLLSLPNRFLHLPWRRSHRIHGGGDAAHHVVGRFLGREKKTRHPTPKGCLWLCGRAFCVGFFVAISYYLLLKGVVFLCFISFCWFVKIAVVRGVRYIYGFMALLKKNLRFIMGQIELLSWAVMSKRAPLPNLDTTRKAHLKTRTKGSFFSRKSQRKIVIDLVFGVWSQQYWVPLNDQKKGPRFLQSPPPFQSRLASLQQDRFMQKHLDDVNMDGSKK